jgi:general secretion pathway protein G
LFADHKDLTMTLGTLSSKRRRGLRADLSAGYSILEVMIVLVIIGMALGMVGPQLFRQLDKAKVQTAESQIKLLRTAVGSFYLDMQRYPTDAEALSVLRTVPVGPNSQLWAGPYLQEQVPVDPWGNPYIYRVGDSRDRPYFLFSYGADGKEGGEGLDKDIGLVPSTTK